MSISDKTIDTVTGMVGLFLVGMFVLGLAWSISTGFAGFWGGLPFWVIGVTVLSMSAYDFWDSTLRSKQ